MTRRKLRLRIQFLASLALLGVGLIVGCQSLPFKRPNLGAINTPAVIGDPCTNADWFEVGRVDALSGTPAEASTYVGRCSAQGVAVNSELYNAGWERGLIDYCTPERGYDAGRSGENYAGVCPSNLEPSFLKRFKAGSAIATLEKQNQAIEREVEQRLTELEAIELTPKKIRIQREIQTLREAKARSDSQIRDLEKSNL